MLKLSDRVRNLPLEPVLELFGCTPDPKDPHRNWRTPVGRLTVTGQQFYCHDLHQGAGGAIDLYLLIRGGTVKEAIRQLSSLSPAQPHHFQTTKPLLKAVFSAADYNNGDPTVQQAVLTYLSEQ